MIRSCRRFQQAISLHASGCLPEADERAAVEAHLAECAACATRCAGVHAMLKVLMLDVQVVVPPQAVTRLRARVRESLEAQVRPAFHWLPRIALAAAGTSLLCLAALIVESRLRPPERRSTSVPFINQEGKTASAHSAPSPPTLGAYEFTATRSEAAYEALLENDLSSGVSSDSEPAKVLTLMDSLRLSFQ